MVAGRVAFEANNPPNAPVSALAHTHMLVNEDNGKARRGVHISGLIVERECQSVGFVD